jgi:hypothetical protein
MNFKGIGIARIIVRLIILGGISFFQPEKTFADDLPWPGGERSRIDITKSDMGNNLSGATWNSLTKKLWIVSNDGVFWRMSVAQGADPLLSSSWTVDTDGQGHTAKWTVGDDTETIAQADLNEATVYLGLERPGPGCQIREYDVSGQLGTAILQNTWDLQAIIPVLTFNGIEALTFVPDAWLKAKNFIDKNGKPYIASVFGTGGLFFAGYQPTAHIFVFDLNRNSLNHSSAEYIFVGEYTAGPAGEQTEIAGMEFDRSDGVLYSYHNYGISNQVGQNDKLLALNITPEVNNTVKTLPVLKSWIGPRINNNEGIAFCSNDEPNSTGNRNFFLTTDGGGVPGSLGIYPSFPLYPTAPPTSRKILPQVAFGGGWYTAFYFANTGRFLHQFSLASSVILEPLLLFHP